MDSPIGRNIPKKIWFLWLQGIENAPLVVEKCLASWEHYNPDYELIRLDRFNLNQYIELNLSDEVYRNLRPAHQADQIRLALLAKYGGVWVDATTYCARPLNGWLDDYLTSGFFAFTATLKKRDRIASTWFMAAEAGNPLVQLWHDAMATYWEELHTRNKHLLRNVTGKSLRKIFNRVAVRKRLEKIFNRSVKTTRYWFTPFIHKTLKLYPYLIVYYMFNKLYLENTQFAEVWDKTPFLDAETAFKFKRFGYYEPVDPEFRNFIDRNTSHLHKLSWRAQGAYTENSSMYYLLEKSTLKI